MAECGQTPWRINISPQIPDTRHLENSPHTDIGDNPEPQSEPQSPHRSSTS